MPGSGLFTEGAETGKLEGVTGRGQPVTLPSNMSPSKGLEHSTNLDVTQTKVEECKQKQETKLVAPLIGEKCILPCLINWVPCETLWILVPRSLLLGIVGLAIIYKTLSLNL